MHRSPQAMVSQFQPPNVSINTPRDPNTLSNYNNFRTQHTVVDFAIDFASRALRGSVTLTLKSITHAETSDVVLDTSYLNIHDVKLNGKAANWSVASRVEPYGSPLSIKLASPPKLDEHIDITIDLATTENCTALQWLTPAQTSNGKHPFMFSQCQAIHARSVFPCQDTPDSKSTYEFRIRSPLQVLASGLSQRVEADKDGHQSTYIFEQKVPIPSYLFALASGDLVSASIGPRSSVWSGPSEIKGAQWELEDDMEKFMHAAESVVYPYAWGIYDVLILPPSFPYGGMENPVVSFLTPTIISKDRQNIDVVAHELSHSWSGNLVSNCSWEHFWLNEGWTTYLERRIQAIMHGEPARDFSAIIGWKALVDSIEMFGEDHEFTKLVTDLRGKDPDDAFSSIPYEKGFAFLYYLEKLLGKEKWDTFIPHYFTTFKYKSLDSYEFKATLLAFFAQDAVASQQLNELDWDRWFYATGYPPKPEFDTSMADVCYELARKWLSLVDSESSAKTFSPSPSDVKGLTGNQIVVFLERLQLSSRPLTSDLAKQMRLTYGFSASTNVEITSRFFDIAMQAGDREVLGGVTDLLSKVGRMKFVRKLYRRLKEVDRNLAIETFEKNKDFYHPICRAMVEKDLIGKD